MDLAALQEKINNYITVVSSWVRNVSALYFSGTPQNVTVDMIDDNGNLTTTTLPNVAQFRKTVWDDVGSALGQFDKTVYIDAVNGNDLNSGTNTFPFQTLGKAVYSCPIGGKINIVLLSDIVMNESIDIKNRSVFINGQSTYSIDTAIFESGDYAYVYNFYSSFHGNGGIYFYFLKNINIPAYSGVKIQNGGLIYNEYLNVTFRDIVVNLNDFNLIRQWDARHSISFVSHNLTINILKSNNIVFSLLSNSILEFYNITILDSSGIVVPIIDSISGIIKDTNGVPRNISSNVVL